MHGVYIPVLSRVPQLSTCCEMASCKHGMQ